MADPLSFAAVDLRVSTMPASYGEKLVIRILDPVNAHIPLPSMGMPERELRGRVSPEWRFCPYYCRHDFVKPVRQRSFA